MSDLCVYEHGDTIWDEFCQFDDHIVPHPSDELANRNPSQGEGCKKPRREVTCISNNYIDGSSDGYVDQGKEQGEFSTLSNRTNTMLEKDSWSQTQNSMFSTSSDSDSIRDVPSLASENARIPIHGFKSMNADSNGSGICVNDPTLADKKAEVYNNSYSYPLGDTSQTDSDLSFFDGSHEDKASSDFLYDGWPEIENFEDVDKMFRSCDSTFGLGAGREDELGLFPSPNALGGSGDMRKSDFNFLCPESNAMKDISEYREPSKLNSTCSINDSAMTTVPIRCKESSWPLHGDELATHPSFVNGPYSSDNKDELTSKEQQQGPDSNDYLHIPCVHSDGSPLSDQFLVHPTLAASKSESNNLTSLSPTESTYASSQAPSKESLLNPLLQSTAIAGSEKREKKSHFRSKRSSLNRNLINSVATVQASSRGCVSVEKHIHLSGNKPDNFCDVGRVRTVIPAELCSPNIGESLSMSLGLDDISLEAASFRKLQLVMGQLDSRTKLCIRDSLYRLARSAEQRHTHENLNGSCGDDRDTYRMFMAEAANKCTGFLGTEIDTNPIDRSIANLLFTCQ